MTEDRTPPGSDNTSEQRADAGRDARGRWKTGHCPNPNGRPKKRRHEDYSPRDLRDFMNTQIEVTTAEGTQRMDRRTAFMNKVFEGAMKGKATAMRMLMADIKESDRQLAELRLHYDRMLAALILDNPDFKSFDESLSRQQRIDMLEMASALNHYYPGQYGAILGELNDEASKNTYEEYLAKLAELKKKEGCQG